VRQVARPARVVCMYHTHVWMDVRMYVSYVCMYVCMLKYMIRELTANTYLTGLLAGVRGRGGHSKAGTARRRTCAAKQRGSSSRLRRGKWSRCVSCRIGCTCGVRAGSDRTRQCCALACAPAGSQRVAARRRRLSSPLAASTPALRVCRSATYWCTGGCSVFTKKKSAPISIIQAPEACRPLPN
jgi:hypothetical protein